MTDYATIVYEKLGGVGRITLNRPQNLNAITVQMGVELINALTRMEEDGDIRCIVLTGAGRSFCAGDDLKGMESEGFPRAAGPDEVKNYVYAPYRWTAVSRPPYSGAECLASASSKCRAGSCHRPVVPTRIRLGVG